MQCPPGNEVCDERYSLLLRTTAPPAACISTAIGPPSQCQARHVVEAAALGGDLPPGTRGADEGPTYGLVPMPDSALTQRGRAPGAS